MARVSRLAILLRAAHVAHLHELSRDPAREQRKADVRQMKPDEVRANPDHLETKTYGVRRHEGEIPIGQAVKTITPFRDELDAHHHTTDQANGEDKPATNRHVDRVDHDTPR